MGARLDNPLPNGGFKTFSDTRCRLCKHKINRDSLTSPIMGRTYKILDNRSCRKDNFCFQQFIMETGDLRKIINNHRSTTKTKKINKPIQELFNVRCHKWEDINYSSVINHNINWTDAERKSQGNFKIHRLKSLRPDRMNMEFDFIK